MRSGRRRRRTSSRRFRPPCATPTIDLPPPLAEQDLVAELERLASRNRSLSAYDSFLGAGVYRRFSPAIVRGTISRPEFYTAYTPYQAEASQGTLQTIFEFQSMICALTGLDVANASLYDGATAAAEAMVIAVQANRTGLASRSPTACTRRRSRCCGPSVRDGGSPSTSSRRRTACSCRRPSAPRSPRNTPRCSSSSRASSGRSRISRRLRQAAHDAGALAHLRDRPARVRAADAARRERLRCRRR